MSIEMRIAKRAGSMAALSIQLFVVSCSAMKSTDPAIDLFPEAQEEVERALRDLLDAVERKDFAKLEAMHLYGPKFSRWDGRSGVRQDAEATRQAERAGLEPLDAFRAEVEGLKVDVFGETAVATFVMPFEAVVGGQTTRAKTKVSLVWVKTGSGWRIAHEHLSPFPPEDKAPAS